MKKTILSLFVVICLLFVACGAGGFEYSEENKNITITEYKGNLKNIKIPRKIKGKSVVSIQNGALVFYVNYLKEIQIIKSKKQKITLPENLDVYMGSFGYSSIYYIYNKYGKRKSTFEIFLDTVKDKDFEIVVIDAYIDKSSFSFVEIINYIGEAKDVEIPERLFGRTVVAIGYSAFADRELTKVTLPYYIGTISSDAFAENNLTSINLPDSITSIDRFAFAKNNLTSINLPASITYIGMGAFEDNQLSKVTLPNSITRIESRTFARNPLKSVIIPDSVIYIEFLAFSESDLISVTFQGKIMSNNLHDEAFGRNLRQEYLNGGIGTYTRRNSGYAWRKQ